MAKFGPAFEVAMQHEVSPAFTLATANDFTAKGFVIFDTGEVSKWGLTLTTLKSLNLIPPDIAGNKDKAIAFVKNMTPVFIEDAYASEFWCAARYKLEDGEWVSSLQEIADPYQVIANKVFDCMVHRGVWGGGTILQEAANLLGEQLVVDGRVSNKTIDAVHALCDEGDLSSLLCALCIRYRRQLEMIIEKNPKDKQFEASWFARAQWPFVSQPVSANPPYPEITVVL